jgi:hypothetical protein
MLRYLTYLLLYIPVQLFAYLITPLLPLFAVKRMGNTDNNSYQSVEWRLPLWMSWLDTPDNPMGRDGNRMLKYGDSYFGKFSGLWTNSLYGWKWSVLAAPANNKVCLTIEGPTNLNHHTKTFGVMRIKRGDGYWQYKSVRPFMGRVLILNFGWLLDDPSQEKALFMCSPRWKKA